MINELKEFLSEINQTYERLNAEGTLSDLDLCSWKSYQNVIAKIEQLEAKIIGEANAQANVSGNKVAVAFADWLNHKFYMDGLEKYRMIDGNRNITFELQELYEKFKTAKATDR